jgi:hypothetical protein
MMNSSQNLGLLILYGPKPALPMSEPNSAEVARQL